MAEIIMVMVLLLLLISLLTPALVGLRYQSRHYQCSNNMKEIAYGFLDYATNNMQRLPGNCYVPQTDPSKPNFTPVPQRSWLFQAASNDCSTAPYSGSLYDFTGSPVFYRCPILPTAPHISGASGWPHHGTGIGSNGLWDYGMYNSFYGARVEMIKLTARFYPRKDKTVTPDVNQLTNMDTTQYTERVTPVIVEEDPYWNVNRDHLDADHSNWDCMGNWHQANPSGQHGAHANYAAIDGSVQFFERVGDYQVAEYAWSLTPGNLVRQIGGSGPAPYALWDYGITNWPTTANAPTPVW